MLPYYWSLLETHYFGFHYGRRHTLAFITVVMGMIVFLGSSVRMGQLMQNSIARQDGATLYGVSYTGTWCKLHANCPINAGYHYANAQLQSMMS